MDDADMSRSRVIRAISVNTKVSQSEYEAIQAQAAARGLCLSEWMRARLLAPERYELVLAEVIATRTIVVNGLYRLNCSQPWTADEYKRLVSHADSVKTAAARAILAGEETSK
jgi:hypothetical protein